MFWPWSWNKIIPSVRKEILMIILENHLLLTPWLWELLEWHLVISVIGYAMYYILIVAFPPTWLNPWCSLRRCHTCKSALWWNCTALATIFTLVQWYGMASIYCMFCYYRNLLFIRYGNIFAHRSLYENFSANFFIIRTFYGSKFHMLRVINVFCFTTLRSTLRPACSSRDLIMRVQISLDRFS